MFWRVSYLDPVHFAKTNEFSVRTGNPATFG